MELLIRSCFGKEPPAMKATADKKLPISWLATMGCQGTHDQKHHLGCKSPSNPIRLGQVPNRLPVWDKRISGIILSEGWIRQKLLQHILHKSLGSTKPTLGLEIVRETDTEKCSSHMEESLLNRLPGFFHVPSCIDFFEELPPSNKIGSERRLEGIKEQLPSTDLDGNFVFLHILEMRNQGQERPRRRAHHLVTR